MMKQRERKTCWRPTIERSLRCLASTTLGVGLLVACSAPPVPLEEEMPTDTGSTTDGNSSTAPTTTSKEPKPTTAQPSTPGSTVTPTPTTTPTSFAPPKDHVPEIDPDFPGIDVALSGTVAPEGCLDGWDEDSQTLSLVLDVDVPGVRLYVEQGVLYANGVACEESALPLAVERIRMLSVRGGGEANLVILDFAVDSFGSTIYEQEGGFRFDGGQGQDALFIRGSRDADEYYVGASNQRLVAALSAFPRINLWAKAFEKASVSLGPGDDAWRPITQLNLGLFDLDSGSVLNITGIDIEQQLWGGDGADELNGGEFNDYLNGGDGNDVLNGGAGGDRFDEGSSMNGQDTMNGGAGLDEVSYALRGEDLTVELCVSTATEGCASDCDCPALSGADGEGDRVVNLEIARTGAGNDVLLGSPGDDYLYAGDGNDTLSGGAGSDVLQGGPGEDDFDGGEDEDICDDDVGETALSCEI